MNTAPSKALPLWILSLAAMAFLFFVVVAPAAHFPRTSALAGLGEPENHARQIVWEARVRTVLNVAVVTFQVAGVACFLLSCLVPQSRVGRQGRVVFVTAMLGLGVTGSLCAWFGSEFALFAGGSMAVFLNGVILGSEAAHHPSTDLRADADRSPLAA
jgi:hypothetical protein